MQKKSAGTAGSEAAPSRKKVKNDIMEVDLHAHELLDTTAGMSNSEILNYQLDVFRKTLEECKNKKGQKIVFIHGKGDGVLRKAILQELKYKYKTMKVRMLRSVNMVSGLPW